jgi:hypothetical protein
MPLGPDRCNGPSGYMYSTIPPPTPKRAEGSIPYFITCFINVNFHIVVYLQKLWHIAAIKYCILHWLSCLIVSILWIVYFGIFYRYILDYL